MFIYNLIKCFIERCDLIYVCTGSLYDYIPINCGKFIIKGVGTKMREITLINLPLFDSIYCRCQDTKLRKVVANISNKVATYNNLIPGILTKYCK